MPNWTAFAGLTGVVLVLLLALAHLTQSQVTGGTGRSRTAARSDSGEASPGSPASRGEAGGEAATGDSPDRSPAASTAGTEFPADGWRWGPEGTSAADGVATDASDDSPDPVEPGGFDDATSPLEPSVADLPKPALLLNAALSQALFGGVLAVGAWWAEIPPAALGLVPAATPWLLGVGVALGLALWLANELAGRLGARFGIEGGEELRALLAPETPGGWALLLVGVLPVVALVEELLFRAALVGALGAGFGVGPWPLVVGSSVAFALGHGAQGRAGMLVTGALGLVFGAAFVVTGSLFVVVVAHYIVNALEFVVHEGFGVGPGT